MECARLSTAPSYQAKSGPKRLPNRHGSVAGLSWEKRPGNWAIGSCASDSQLNASPDFAPVMVGQPSNNAHIALEQRDQIQPKTRRGMQTGRFPVPDLAIGRAQRVRGPGGNQTQDDVRAMALISRRGNNNCGSCFGCPGAWEGCDYDVPRRQDSSRSRSSNLDKDARCASARSSSVHVADQSTRLPFARLRSCVAQVIT